MSNPFNRVVVSGVDQSGAFARLLPTILLLYGPLMTLDASIGGVVQYTLTDGVAHQIDIINPPSAGGQIITLVQRNNSGGAGGQLSFGAMVLFDVAIANFANGKQGTVAQLFWNGTKWVDILNPSPLV